MMLTLPKDPAKCRLLQQAFISASRDNRFTIIVDWLKENEQRMFRLSRTTEGIPNNRLQGALLLLDDYFKLSKEDNARKVLQGLKQG